MEMQNDLKGISQNKTLFRSMLKAYLKRKYNMRFGNKQKEELANYIFQKNEHLLKNTIPQSEAPRFNQKQFD